MLGSAPSDIKHIMRHLGARLDDVRRSLRVWRCAKHRIMWRPSHVGARGRQRGVIDNYIWPVIYLGPEEGRMGRALTKSALNMIKHDHGRACGGYAWVVGPCVAELDDGDRLALATNDREDP